MKEIGARYDKLTFKYTGPWPPYNFVNIRLKLERSTATPGAMESRPSTERSGPGSQAIRGVAARANTK